MRNWASSLLALFLLAGPAWADITVDATNSADSGSPQVSLLAVTLTVGASATDVYLCVGWGAGGGVTISSVAVSGCASASLTELAALAQNNAVGGALYQWATPAAGSCTFTVTPSADTRMAVGVISYTGVATTGTAAITGANNTDSPSIAVTSVTGDTVVGCIAHANETVTITVDGSQTLRFQDVTSNPTSSVNRWITGSDETASGTSTPHSGTLSASGTWVAVGVALTPVPGRRDAGAFGGRRR